MDIDIKKLLKQVESSHSILRSNKSFMKKAGYILKNASGQIKSLASGLERQQQHNKKIRSSSRINSQNDGAQQKQGQKYVSDRDVDGDDDILQVEKYLGNVMLKKLGYSIGNQLFHIGSYLLEQHKYLKQHGNSVKLTKKKIKRNPEEAKKKREKNKKELQISISKIQLIEKSMNSVSSRYNSQDNSDQMTIKSKSPINTSKMRQGNDSSITTTHNKSFHTAQYNRRLNTSISQLEEQKHQINIANESNIRNSRNQNFLIDPSNFNLKSQRNQSSASCLQQRDSNIPSTVDKFHITRFKNSSKPSIARSRASDLKKQNLQTKLFIQKQMSIRKQEEFQQALMNEKMVRAKAYQESNQIVERTASECQQSALIFLEQLKWFIMETQELVEQFNLEFPEMIKRFNLKYQKEQGSDHLAYDQNNAYNPLVYKSLQDTANILDIRNSSKFNQLVQKKKSNFMEAKAVFREENPLQDISNKYRVRSVKDENVLRPTPSIRNLEQSQNVEEKLFGLQDDDEDDDKYSKRDQMPLFIKTSSIKNKQNIRRNYHLQPMQQNIDKVTHQQQSMTNLCSSFSPQNNKSLKENHLLKQKLQQNELYQPSQNFNKLEAVLEEEVDEISNKSINTKIIDKSFEYVKASKVKKSSEKLVSSQNEFRSFTASNKTPTHERYASQDDDYDNEQVQFAQSRQTKTELFSPISFIIDDNEECLKEGNNNNNHSKSFQISREKR